MVFVLLDNIVIFKEKKTMKSKTITLTDVTPGAKKNPPLVINRHDLEIGVIALRELSRNNMGLVNYHQIKTLEKHIVETKKKRFTKKELHEIIGDTEYAE
jgi:mRNA-degrading endonuclease toxin of MazEF toxin-antitoxin module